MLIQTSQADLTVTDGLCDVTLDARYGDAKAQEKTVILTLENTGNASMTVYEPSLRVSESGINLTTVASFPITIASGASKDVQIKVCVAGTVGEGTYPTTADFAYGSGTITINVDRLIPAHLAPLPNIDAGTVVFDEPEKEIKKANFQSINDGDTSMTLNSVAAYGNPEAGMTFSVDHPSQISEQSAGTATLTVTIPATAPDGEHQGRLRIDAGKAGSQTITVTVTVEHIASEEEAEEAEEEVEIRGEVVDAAVQIAPFTWTGQNFAGLHYDVDRNIMSEALTTTVTVPDMIDKEDLVYTTYRVESGYTNPEIGEYFEIWWFGEKYMAINGKPYVISPIILEMDEDDKKVLATGEEWDLGNGYSLTAVQIDLDGDDVRLTLDKGGVEVYSSVIRLYNQGDWFNNCMSISGSLGAYTVTTDDIQTSRTFAYQAGVGSDADVPIFSVYVDAIFRGTTTNIVQLKYAILIDDNLVSVIDEGAGMLDVQTVTPELVRLESDGEIPLDPNSDFHIAEGLRLHVADDRDGNSVQNHRYYPYISHECPKPEPTPTPTPTPVEEVVEIRGEVVEPTSTQTGAIAWNASNFAAFWYDLNDDVATETLTIAPGTLSEYDRTIDANDLVYDTMAVDVDFDYDRWGSYSRIGFIAEEYFAGYGDMTDNEITDEPINLLSEGILSKVLIDEDEKHTISTGASLRLGEGYELKIIQLDINGNKAQIELIRDGERISGGTGIVDAPDTFVYTKDLGSIADVPVIAIHVSSVFAGTENDMVVIDGIFQISDDYTYIKIGRCYNEMKVTSTSGDRIVMQNYDDITLREGKTISLMGDIKLVVADNETLRFAPVAVLTEPGTYDVRGAVWQPDEYQSDEIVWNASNSAFFWHDLDSDASSETLTIAPGTLAGCNRTIYEDSLSYATHPVYQEYELHENEGLTVEGWDGYQAEGWMGRRYVAINGRADRLSELLLEFEDTDKKTLLVGEGWDLGGGFTLTPMQIDLEGDKVWLTLNKDGRELDSTVVSSGEVCTCTVDIGDEDDVPIFSCYVDAVFRGTDTNIVQVKYVFLINDDPLEIAAGDRFERMRVVTASSGEVVLRNDVIVSLGAGITEKVMDEMYFRTAKDSTIRFYPFMERTIHGASGGGGGGTYPPEWNATPPAGGDDDSVIFEQYMRINEGIEINYDIRIEVAEVSENIVDSAKFRISSYMMPARTITLFLGDIPCKYETYSGSSIYIEMLSVQNTTVFFRVTGPDEWRVTDYYEVEPDEPPIPATDSDRDGVPDAWDKEPGTPPGYWTDSDGRGQRWGDMNGDGKLTSVDALMMLKAAAGGTC